MRVGFTGTRRGMTEAQRTELLRLLREWLPTEFHHGACIGADAEAHEVVRLVKEGRPAHTVPKIVVHPCGSKTQRAHCPGAFEVLNVLPPLVRNRRIVDAVDVLVAAPAGPEVQRSGTWATVRYARKVGRKVVFV